MSLGVRFGETCQNDESSCNIYFCARIFKDRMALPIHCGETLCCRPSFIWQRVTSLKLASLKLSRAQRRFSQVQRIAKFLVCMFLSFIILYASRYLRLCSGVILLTDSLEALSSKLQPLSRLKGQLPWTWIICLFKIHSVPRASIRV